MSLQEQLNELYDEEKEGLAHQARILANSYRAIPDHLAFLAQRTGLTPERILACARMMALDHDPWYRVIERMVVFYQNDAILTQKHQGETSQ